ncbi:hypothetical protein RVD_001 [Diatom colony associated dsRNA virus 1]|nr:hypothetical protein RVD_001 [Diatom colony associated dsRNA virus 1]
MVFPLSFVVPNPRIVGRQIVRNSPSGRGLNPVSGGNSISGAEFVKMIAKEAFKNRNVLSLNANFHYNGGGSDGNNKDGDSGKGKGKGNNGNGGGNNNNNPKPRRGQGEGRPYYPHKTVKTGNLDYRSGIKSGTLRNAREVESSTEYSTCYILNGSFFSDLTVSSPFYDLMVKDIYQSYLAVVRKNTNVRTAKYFSETAFFDYIKAISSALQTYFEVESILAYNIEPANINQGMLELQYLLDPEVLGQHERLKNTLLGTPMPKDLVLFFCYMYSNFTFDPHPGGHIYRLGFRKTLVFDSPQKVSYGYYEVLKDDLFNVGEVTSILSKCFKKEMFFDEFPRATSSVIFDDNFRTFWANSSLSYFDKSSDNVKYTFSVPNSSTNTNYFEFCEDEVDGIFYACNSMYCRDINLFKPGLWLPLQGEGVYANEKPNQCCNLLCYCSNYGGFVSPEAYRTAINSGIIHTIFFDYSESRFYHFECFYPSSKKIQVHSVDNVASCLFESILKLLNV